MALSEGNEVDRDYMAVCEKCNCCMDSEVYQAAEHLAHQVAGDGLVHCPACGCRDWRFENLED